MTVNAPQSATQAWTDELNSVGRIEFKAEKPNISWWYLVLSFSFVIFMMWIGYLEGRFTAAEATISTTVVLGSALVLILWMSRRHSGAVMIVELDNVRLLNGTRLYWSEIVAVRPYNHARSHGSGTLFEVSQPAWDRHLHTLGFWSRLNLRLTKVALRGRIIHMPSHLNVHHGELVAWLDSFAQGKKETEVGEKQSWQTQV